MIHEIFRRIGSGANTFVEFGVETGIECNTTLLLLRGWRGAWIEGSAERAAKARAIFESYSINVSNAFVTAENVDSLIA